MTEGLKPELEGIRAGVLTVSQWLGLSGAAGVGRTIHVACSRTWNPAPPKSTDPKLSFTPQPGEVSIRSRISVARAVGVKVTASG